MAFSDTMGSVFTEIQGTNNAQHVPISISASIDDKGSWSLYLTAGISRARFIGDPDAAALECLAWMQDINGSGEAYEKILKEKELATLVASKAETEAKIAIIEADLAKADVVVEEIIP